MSEVGFKREVYTMYDPSEELGRERWRNIAKGVQLDKDGAEIVEWTQRCTSGVSAVSTVGRGSAMSVVSDEDVGIAL